MVAFKPLNLARQSFIKTFTHGYAQSLVAASQSSSASQNTSFHSLSSNVSQYFGNRNTNVASQHAASAANQKTTATTNDSGLAAYYAAWQRHQKAGEKEQHQFQFAKRIGWKAPTTIPDPVQVNSKSQAPSAELAEKQDERSPRPGIQRAQSADAITETLHTTEPLAKTTSVDELSDHDKSLSTSLELETEATSVASSNEDAYTTHLSNLADRQQYGDIPAVFEAMLVAGIKPSATSYNALLLSAINLARGRHQVASKVLDVYADMLNRHIEPDTQTYAIVIELLAARSLDVLAMKKELSSKTLADKTFLMPSDATEAKILEEDDSLSVAIKLFDTTAAVSAKHIFGSETYRLLLAACAETGRVDDMVRIYADMESRNIVPQSSIFAPMIEAFAAGGDLRSAVECYDEYKALAVSHDNGEIDIVRKDEEVYAAVINAYATCGRLNGGLKFLGKIQDSLQGQRASLDQVLRRSLYPIWFKDGQHAKALEHACTALTDVARLEALCLVCVDAASRNLSHIAQKAFDNLQPSQPTYLLGNALSALLRMYIDNNNLSQAAWSFKLLKSFRPDESLIDLSTRYARLLIDNGECEAAFGEIRQVFASIRQFERSDTAAINDRMDEAVEVLISQLSKTSTLGVSLGTTMQILWIMAENGNVVLPVAHRLLTSIGPHEIFGSSDESIVLLTQIQSNFISTGAAAHDIRMFCHLVDTVLSRRIDLDERTCQAIERVISLGQFDDLAVRWRHRLTPVQPSTELDFDPYGVSTDYKGSSMITDLLEKPHGRHGQLLADALSRVRNMRRVGRHPRFATYARLISAAAKENQFNTAEDILAMVKQDMPLLPHNKIVFQGWTTVLDAMVGACLTTGRRDLARQYHQDLLTMGASPSANTFGLYITTLKESTKTFDEATEAVKIFHQAKNEGVEPTSFLYNALIGKLGKARRIDDCLYYFAEMRSANIRPTSVTYGTIVNALCRVSDGKFAEELFDEMESMSNYKPRPAPYNSMMQYFLTTKRDRSKVLAYFERMKACHIEPTMHTYKLLIDTHATLEPVDFAAAESIVDEIRKSGATPEAVHFASLIHAKGCVLHDLKGAQAIFDSVVASGEVKPQSSLYQSLFESYVANHAVSDTEPLLKRMVNDHKISITPYIANTLIHGWAMAGQIDKARRVFQDLGRDKREPSTYEAMTRANLAVGDHAAAMQVVGEALKRGYPAAVANKICDIVGNNEH